MGAAFLANAAPTNLSPATATESPLELLTAAQKDYLYVKTFEERRTAAEDANDTYDRLFCYGSPVELKWTGTTGTCTVEVKRTSDGKVVWTGTTDGLSVKVYNLELGADYEWSVTCDGVAARAAFTTSDQPPRLIKTGQVRMLRDLGGWTGTLDGRQYRVRQNLIFRGAAVDDPKATGTQPSYLIEDDSDRDFFYNVVRLKNEVDLRNLNNTTGSSPDLTPAAKQSGQYMLDPTGEHVTYNNCPFTASSALSASGGFFDALKLLLNPDKLPAYFHCKSGRDRTGMVGAFLLALLGVSRDDIIRDYQTTSDQNNWSKYGFSTFLDTSLGQYQKGTTSLAENARAFLLNNGITSAQIETFRETMLEGYGEPPSPTFAVTPYLQNPSSDAMTIIFFTTGPCESTVTCQRHDAGTTSRRVLTETTVGVWAEALTNNTYQLKQGVEKNRWKDSLYKHRVRFEGLEPNRTYDYTVTLADSTTYSNAFRTAPDRDTPIRFVSYADCETTSSTFANYTANLNRMRNHDPDLITSAGDLVARGGIQSYWDEFWMQNAGGNGIGQTDVLGSIPMLTAIGNHDLFDNVAHDAKTGFYHDAQGEFATEKFLTYFEHNPNGVPYAYRDGTNQAETRDMSQLFHREDFGPVTLIFLDSNNGQDGDTDDDHDRDSNYCKSDNKNHEPGGMDRRKGARHPDFNPGTPQYTWFTNNLADAQAKSRFTFVFNHHCPYSRGTHNQSWRTGEDASALPLRVLTEAMVRYGVDGWYCGHDELLEHSITNGYEILPDGRRRKHTLSIYDLGGSGDDPRTGGSASNPLEYNYMGNYGGGNYGFLETDVTTNGNGRWTCTITPIQGSSGNAVAGAQIVYVENPDRGENENDLVYAEYAQTKAIDGVSPTKPSDWVAWERPPEGPAWDETVDVELTAVNAVDLTYNGAEQSPRLTVKAGDLIVPRDHYTVTTSPSSVRNAREYSVTVTGTGNVKGSKTTSFTVNRAPATVKAKDISMVVGTVPEPALEVEVTGTFGSDTVTYRELSREDASGVGTYAITVTGDKVQGNYDVTFVNGWFTIKEDVAFVDGEDAEIAVDGETTVDVGEKTITVGKVTIKGSGDLTIANYQNLKPSSVDLNEFSGTVTYEYISPSANKSLPSGLANTIKGQADQRVKYAFRGTSAANGWNLGSWDKTVFSTHIVIDVGTHTWSQNNNGVSGNVFGKNGTDENPTLLVKDGAILNFTGKDLSGYQNGFQDGGVIRVNAGGTLNFKQPSGSNPNMNYRQRLVLDPGSLTTFAYGTDKFVLHGAGATPGETATQMKANIYVPASDGTAGPAIFRCVSSGGVGLCINNTSNSRGGGCAIYIGENSKLLLDAKVSKGEENDSSSNKRILAKLGPGELEITGEVTSSVDFDARAGIIALPSGQGKFNKSFTAAEAVTYRFPAGWENDTAYTLGSGTVNGTAPATDKATVYVGEKKLTGVTLVYSGKTVRYVKPPEPQPIASVTVVANLTYNGAVQTPSVVVTAQDGTTVPSDAYRVSTDPAPVRAARDYTLTVTGITDLYTDAATTQFTMNRAQATVKADDVSKEFGAEDPEFTATVTGTYGDDTLDYELAREDDDENYGAHWIRAFGDDVQGNYDVTYEKGTLAITKAMPKPEGALTAEITYGTKLSGATVVGKMKYGDNEVEGTFTFVELNRGPSFADSGTEYAAVFTPSNTSNYASAEVKVKVTVAKRVLTVHAANASVAYGTDTPAYGYVLSGFVSGESVANVTIRGNPTYASGYSQTLPVGECEVSVATIGTLDADNYSFAVDSTAAKLTVTQRQITSATAVAVTYDGVKKDPVITVKADSLDVATFTVGAWDGDLTNAGTYRATVTGTGNFAGTAEVRFTISPASLTAATAASQPYAATTLTPVVVVLSGTNEVPSAGYTVSSWSKAGSEGGSNINRSIGKYQATVTGRGNYTGTVTVYFSVVKADYDMSGVTFEDATVTYDGQAHSLAVGGTLPVGVSSGAKVTVSGYSLQNLVNVGSYAIAVSFKNGDTSHYNTPSNLTATLTIVPAPITSANAAAATYTGSEQTTPKLIVEAGELTLQSGDYTISDWNVTPKDAGTYMATVTGTGNFTDSVGLEFTIDPAPLTAAIAEEQVYDGTVKTPVLKVQAGSLAVDTYDLGAWSGGLVGAGTYTAEVSGTGNFTGSQTVTFKIRKATYEMDGVRFAGATFPYNGEAHSLAIEGELPKGVSVRYEGNTQTDAGTYTVTAIFEGDGDNYEPIANKTATLTIGKVTLTSATAAAATYTGKPQTPKLTVKARELTLQPGDYTISGWNETPKDAGTYTAIVTGTGNFTDSVGLEFTISSAPLTVKADDQGVGAGEDPPPFTVSYSGFVNGEDASKLSGTLGFTCAYNPAEATVGQTFEIVPGGLTADNYTITFESGTLTVGKSTPRLKSLTADEITYGETLASSALKGEAQDAMENPVTGTFVWADASIAPTVAESGTSYDVTFTPDDTESYTVAHFHATVTVNPAELTIAVSNATAVYGAAAPKFGCEITGFIKGEDESVVSGARRLTCSYKPFDNAGTYAITPDLSTFEADNYTFKSAPGTLTVDKATLTVSAKDLTVTYWDAPPAYAATCSGFLGRDTASVVSGTADLWCAYQQGDKIGQYDIVVSGVSGLSAANYDFIAAETPGKLTVGRKSVTVTADNKEKSYGAADPELTATVTGTVGEDTVVYDLAVNYKGASSQEASVGRYTITASGATDQGNYTVAYKSGTMEVKQASLIGENLAVTIEYGQMLRDAKVTGVVKSASRIGGQSVSVAGTFTFKELGRPLTVEESGPYTATFTPENTWVYKPADLTVFVTVTQKKLTVKAVDEEIVYGDVPPAEHACTITGFIDGEDESVVSGDCGYVCKYAQFGDVGEYPIEVNHSGLSAENYFFAAAETPGRLTVRPKTLTVKAADKAITYGDAPPADHTCEITGFVDGEDESVVSGACAYLCTYEQYDNIGKYPIAVDLGDLSAGNYVFAAAETPGQLTVGPATITGATAASQTFTGERLNPVLTVKAGDLTLQSGDYTVSNWSGNLTDAGAYTATVTGTGNFTGTAEVIFEVTEADYDMSGVTFEDDVVTYDGKVHALAIGGELPAGVTVEYDVVGETEAGEYKVTANFSGDSNHKAIAARTATLTINKAKLTSATAELTVYDGTVKTPVLTVLSGALEVKTYALGDWDGELKEAGTYMAMVTGTGNFEGDVTVIFTIRRAQITAATTELQTYDGSKKTPVLKVMAGELECTTYDLGEWSGNLTDAGTYTATVRGTGDFAGEIVVSFTIRGEVIVTIPARDGLVSHVYADGIELQPVGESGDGVAYEVPVGSKVVVEFAADGASGVRIAGGVQRYEIGGIDRDISFGEAGDYRIPVTVDMSEPTETKPVVKVAVASGCEGRGSVSGGGAKTAAGKQITLKATAAKNCVFAGWYLDDACTCPAADDWRNPSYLYTVTPVPETTLYAKFLPASDPVSKFISAEVVSYAYAKGDDFLVVPAGQAIEPIRILVTTPVTYTVTAKNLPTGLKLARNKTTGEYTVTGKATKPGELSKPVTLTVKNAVNATGVTKTFRILVDNYRDEAAFPGLANTYDQFVAGIWNSVTIPALTNGTAAKVTGLPGGLSFKKATATVSGTAAKPGKFLVTFTKTEKVKKSGKTVTVTHTATALFVVYQGNALPEPAERHGVITDGIVITPALASKPDWRGEKLEFRVGVVQEFTLAVEGLEGAPTTVTATGLPAGLKLVKKTFYVNPKAKKKVVDHYEWSISGVPTAAGKLSHVVLKGTNKYKWTGTSEFDIEVLARPSWASGTYDGILFENGATNGAISLTVSAKGAVKGTIGWLENGQERKYTLAASSLAAYDAERDVYTLKPAYKVGTNTVTHVLELAQSPLDGRYGIISSETALLYQNAAVHGGVPISAEVVSYAYAKGDDFLVVPAGQAIEPIRILVTTPVSYTVTAKNLPTGLKLARNKTTGEYTVTGKATKPGELSKPVTLTVKNAVNATGVTKTFRILVDNYRDEAAFPGLANTYDQFVAGIWNSVTIPALTNGTAAKVTGLPGGLSFKKATATVSGTAAKPGKFLVTFTKTEKVKKSGKTVTVTHTATTLFVVYQGNGLPDPASRGGEIRDGIVITPSLGSRPGWAGEKLDFYVGVPQKFTLAVEGLAGVDTTVTAKGLPSGLKLVKTTDKATKITSYTIEGVPTAASSVDKKTGVVKLSHVILSGTNKYKWTGSAEFDIEVLALPVWAQGTYDGAVFSKEVETGTATLTISAKGAVSGTIREIVAGKERKLTLKASSLASYDPSRNVFILLPTYKDSTETVTRTFELAANAADRRLGRIESDGILLLQNPWKNAETKTEFAGAFKPAETLSSDGLTLTVKANGAVTIAGRVIGADGVKEVSLSSSAQAIWNPEDRSYEVVVYVAPKTNFEGLCRIVKLLIGLD